MPNFTPMDSPKSFFESEVRREFMAVRVSWNKYDIFVGEILHFISRAVL